MSYRKGTREDKKPVPWNTDDDDFHQLEYIRYYPLPVPPRASSENPSILEMEQASTEENNQLPILESSELTRKKSKGAGEGLHIGGSNSDANKEKTHRFQISRKRESSDDTNQGGVHDSAGDLDSDAGKEDNQPIISLSKRKRTKQEIVASVQVWQKGEDVPDSVGEDVTKVEKNILTSSPSVLAGLSSDDLYIAQIEYELSGREGGSLENFVRMQQEVYSNHQVVATPLAVQEPSRSSSTVLELMNREDSGCLFEVEIPLSNRLPIPYELAGEYFKPFKPEPEPNHLRDYPLHLIDYLGEKWEMRYVRFQEEEAYIIVRGWEQYVARYGVRPGDTIRFYWNDIMTREGVNKNHFIIYHVRRPEGDSDSSFLEDSDPPALITGDPFCELSLSEADVTFWRLVMPGVDIPSLSKDKEFVKLTDNRSRDWYVMIVRIENGYMILDSWGGIIKEHGPSIGDIVGFYYVPGSADHEKHFFITFRKPRD